MKKVKVALATFVLVCSLAVPTLGDGGTELPGGKPCTANCGRPTPPDIKLMAVMTLICFIR